MKKVLMIIGILFISNSVMAGWTCAGLEKTGSNALGTSDIQFIDNFSDCSDRELELFNGLLQDSIKEKIINSRNNGFSVDQRVSRDRTLLNSVKFEILSRRRGSL